MTDYKVGRSDICPSYTIPRVTRWSFFWDEIARSFDEGYGGWVTIEIPTLKILRSLAQSLYYRRRRTIRESELLEFHFRRQKDNTYILYARITKAE